MVSCKGPSMFAQCVGSLFSCLVATILIFAMIHSWVNVLLPIVSYAIIFVCYQSNCLGQYGSRHLRRLVALCLIKTPSLFYTSADNPFHCQNLDTASLKPLDNLSSTYWNTPTRIGEAAHPGPVNIALVNPTSIVSKTSQFGTLVSDHNTDIICASETAATAKAQKLFATTLKTHCGFKSLWSNPVEDQFHRSDGDGSFRGRASGVGVFSKLPMRLATDTLTEEMQTTSRLIHTVHTVGAMQFQILTVYGLASHSPSATATTDGLIVAALEASRLLRLPTIICGDFNALPLQLECGSLLSRYGFQDLLQLHHQIYGKVMQPTCRDTTNPDNALLCPAMTKWLTGIKVEDEQLFDCHKVVCLSFNIPHEEQFVSRFAMPRSWIQYAIDPSSIPLAYQQVSADRSLPSGLEEWGSRVEAAIDLAYQHTQRKQNIDPTCFQTIPPRDKGRCKPRRFSNIPIASLTPKPRPGDYQPRHEVHTFKTQRLIKQLRRLQSFRRRLAKLPQGSCIGLCEEWKAILHSKAPDGSFLRWCQNTPELGPPPRLLPSLDFVHLAEQFVRLQVDNDVKNDHQIWLRKLEFNRYLDVREQGCSQAFSRLKDTWKQPYTEIKEKIVEPALVVPETPDAIRLYCDNPDQFDPLYSVSIDQIPCHIQTIDTDSLVVLPTAQEHAWPEEADVCQQIVHHTPKAIVKALVDFWDPFWNNPRAGEETHPDFQKFLDHFQEFMCRRMTRQSGSKQFVP